MFFPCSVSYVSDMFVQHEVEICRSEQPFVIQSRCAEAFTGADSQVVSPTTDDHPLAQDAELPGPSGLSAQPADDANMALSSAVDINDITKTVPPSKSMMCCFLFVVEHVAVGRYFVIACLHLY